MDYEQLAQEDAMFPWLASDCMADMYDDEETKFEVEEHYGYDDLAFGLPLESGNDF